VLTSQTSKPASASTKANASPGPLSTHTALLCRRPCCRSTAGRLQTGYIKLTERRYAGPLEASINIEGCALATGNDHQAATSKSRHHRIIGRRIRHAAYALITLGRDEMDAHLSVLFGTPAPCGMRNRPSR